MVLKGEIGLFFCPLQNRFDSALPLQPSLLGIFFYLAPKPGFITYNILTYVLLKSRDILTFRTSLFQVCLQDYDRLNDCWLEKNNILTFPCWKTPTQE